MKRSKRVRMIIALAIIGMLVSIFLTVIHFTGSGGTCPIEATNGEPSCDVVAKSPYSKMFGIPISIFAFFVYGFYFLAGWFLHKHYELKKLHPKLRRGHLHWSIFLISGSAFIYAIYLIYILYYVIKATCPYCIIAHSVTLLIMIFSGWNLYSRRLENK